MPNKILVVDDENDILSIVSFRLREANFEVITVSDGQAAMDAVKKVKPDLIILDLRIPLVSGQEVCRRIKTDKDYSSIPIILLTASSGVINPQELQELKADDFMMKPFDCEELLQKVNKFLGG